MEKLPVVLEEQSAYKIQQLIALAIEKQVPVEALEKLLDMADRIEAKAAEKAFYIALAAFQAHCPIIEKKKKGAVAKYAPLEDIFSQVRELLTQHGFSFTFKSAPSENRYKAICVARHIGGHSEETPFEPRLIKSNNAINNSQQDAGTLTLAMRRAFCNAFGILTRDEDTDAEEPMKEYITIEQIAELRSLFPQTQYTEEKMLERLKLTRIEDLLSIQAIKVLDGLNVALSKRKDK